MATKAKPETKKVEAPKKVEKAVKAEKPKAEKVAVVEATEVQVMGGTYKLSTLMVELGFPAFAHDAPRLFEKGIVSVDGEVVTADAEYHVGNIVITKGDESFRVVGMVLTAPK